MKTHAGELVDGFLAGAADDGDDGLGGDDVEEAGVGVPLADARPDLEGHGAAGGVLVVVLGGAGGLGEVVEIVLLAVVVQDEVVAFFGGEEEAEDVLPVSFTSASLVLPYGSGQCR